MLVCHQINTEFVTLLVFTSCTCHPKTSKNEYDISHIHSLCLISHMVVPRIKRFIQTEWMSFHLKKKKMMIRELNTNTSIKKECYTLKTQTCRI